MKTLRFGHIPLAAVYLRSPSAILIGCLGVALLAGVPAMEARAGFWDEVREIGEEVKDTVKKGEDAIRQEIGQEEPLPESSTGTIAENQPQAEAATPPAAPPAAPTKSPVVQEIVPSGGALTYASALELYIARHRDLLDNDAFAWKYFKVFEAPADKTPGCVDLQRKAQNPITLAQLMARERETLGAELAAFENAPTSAVFEVEGRLVVDPRKYDLDRELFPVKGFWIPEKASLLPYSGCVLKDAPGVSYAPGDMIYLEITGKEAMETLPIKTAQAQALIDEAPGAGLDVSLSAVVKLRVGEAESIADTRSYGMPARILGVSIKDPASGRIVYEYPAATFLTGAEVDPTTADAGSETLPQLAPHLPVLMLLRDEPSALTGAVVDEFTVEQIKFEQKFWHLIHGNLAGDLRQIEGPFGSPTTLNMKRPLFAYEWQLLREGSPEVAEQVTKTFVRADASWDFYQRAPEYDSRLDAYVEASVFSRSALGIMDYAEMKAMTQHELRLMRNPGRDVTQLIPELAPVMRAHLLQASEAAPRRVRLDFELAAKYDARQGRLLFGKSYSVDEKKPAVDPLEPWKKPKFADDGASLTSIIRLPLPRSAEDRILYRVPHWSARPETDRPSRSESKTPSEHWREMLKARASHVASIDILALDRKVRIEPLAVPQARLEAAQSEASPYGIFPVTGRVILDIERVDSVLLNAKLSNGDAVQRRNGALFAKVAAIEIIGPQEQVLASVDLSTLDSADALAAAAANAQAEKQAEQQAAAQAEQSRIDARRAALRNADIAGIRLGMTVAEAEKIIRQGMEVARVVSPADGATPTALSPNRPYRYFKAFAAANGKEQITLFWHPQISDRIVGVTRSLRLPEGASEDAVMAQLLDKYGQQPVKKSDFGVVWTVDFGTQKRSNVSAVDDSWRYKWGTCKSALGQVGLSSMQIEEVRSSPDARSMPRVTDLRIWGGRLPRKQGGYSDAWDPGQWKACGPMVLADIRSTSSGSDLRVGLLDLAAYAPDYAELMEASTKSANVDLDL